MNKKGYRWDVHDVGDNSRPLDAAEYILRSIVGDNRGYLGFLFIPADTG